MNITNATVVYFTGTDTTKVYASTFAKHFPRITTMHSLRYDNPIEKTFSANELLVLASPVFGGYLPSFVWEQLENVQGTQTPAVLLAVYGARDYDNALLEMDTKLSEKGFVTVAAAALVARHSIVTNIAPHRPSGKDLSEVERFTRSIFHYLEDLDSIEDIPPFHFKGNLEGHPAKNPAPQPDENCNDCRMCAAECPTGAITRDHLRETDESKCISCMRCVEYCPFDARHASEAVMERAKAFLSKTANPTKQNEYFLPENEPTA